MREREREREREEREREEREREREGSLQYEMVGNRKCVLKRKKKRLIWQKVWESERIRKQYCFFKEDKN